MPRLPKGRSVRRTLRITPAVAAWLAAEADRRSAELGAPVSGDDIIESWVESQIAATDPDLPQLIAARGDRAHNATVMGEVAADGAAAGAREDCRRQLVDALGIAEDAPWSDAIKHTTKLVDAQITARLLDTNGSA